MKAKSSNYNSHSFDDSTHNMSHISAKSQERSIYRFKVILLGDTAVGKTSVLSKFTTNKIDLQHNCTIGVEYKVKSLVLDDKSAADLQIWDTCGQEKYKTVTRSFYRDSNGI